MNRLTRNNASPASKKKPSHRIQWSDSYTKQAKSEGFFARSVFKLQEIDKRFRIFEGIKKFSNPKILDLGASPGSWVQWCLSHPLSKKAHIYTIDLNPLALKGHKRVSQTIGDLCQESIYQQQASYAPFSLILCDAAPSSTGNRIVDNAQSKLLHDNTQRYIEYLAKGGNFVCKIFSQQILNNMMNELKPKFAQVRAYKPRASRSASREQYIITINKLHSANFSRMESEDHVYFDEIR